MPRTQQASARVLVDSDKVILRKYNSRQVESSQQMLLYICCYYCVAHV